MLETKVSKVTTVAVWWGLVSVAWCGFAFEAMEMCGGGLWGVAPGQVTGHSELLLCTLSALVEGGQGAFPMEAQGGKQPSSFSQVTSISLIVGMLLWGYRQLATPPNTHTQTHTYAEHNGHLIDYWWRQWGRESVKSCIAALSILPSNLPVLGCAKWCRVFRRMWNHTAKCSSLQLVDASWWSSSRSAFASGSDVVLGNGLHAQDMALRYGKWGSLCPSVVIAPAFRQFHCCEVTTDRYWIVVCWKQLCVYFEEGTDTSQNPFFPGGSMSN